MTKDQIREIFMTHGFTIKEGQTDLKQYVYDAAYALLARQPAAIDKAAVPWPVPRSIETNYEIGQTVELIFESDEDAETFSRLYSEQMGDKLPQEDCNLYSTPLATEASKPAPSVEQDERGAWEQLRGSLAVAMCAFATKDGSRGLDAAVGVLDAITEPGSPIAWLRAASTSANVAQGAEAVPTERGVYAWVAEGSAALVLVHTRPSVHSPGGVLKASVINSSKFYDGCPVDQWTGGTWFGPLRKDAAQSASGDTK